MRFRIETLGEFRLVNLQDGTTIPLRSNSRLLSYLAVQAPHFVSRKALVAVLWPEVDGPTANNRLRVALNKLRGLLHGAIVEGPGGLSLAPDVVESDVSEFLKLVEEAGDTSREEDEFYFLSQAFHCCSRNLGSWIAGDLGPIPDTFHKVCLRLAELGLKLRQDNAANEVCTAGLRLHPSDPDLWRMLLQARMNLGQGESAVREISAIKDRSLLAHKEVRAAIDQIIGGAEGDKQTQFSASESHLAAELMKAMVSTKPDVARVVLSSPETLTVAGAHPKQMLSLLERVVAEPLPGDEHWERCMARIVGLKAWVGDVQGVFDYGGQLVQTCTRPLFLRATWNAIALGHALRREWPKAMEAIATTIRYAEQTGNEIDVLSAEGNRAYFLWHQGSYDEAEEEYDRTLKRIRELGTEQAEFEYIMGFGNQALIPVMRGDWPLALSRLEECNDLRTNGPRKISMGILLPCLALARLMSGRRDGVLSMLRQTFFEANVSESEQFLQRTFEFAACALSQTEHKEYARAVMDWVEAWRERTKLPRAQAENDLFGLFFEGPAGDVVLPADASVIGREMLGRLRRSLGE